MKALGIIIATFMIIAALLVSMLGASKSLDAADEIDHALTSASAETRAAAESVLGETLPSTLRLEVGALLGLLACLVSLALLVTVFIKRNLLVPIAITTLAISAVAVLVLPTVPTGPLDGMAPRPQQLVATVLFALGAGAALLVKRAAARKAAPALAPARAGA